MSSAEVSSVGDRSALGTSVGDEDPKGSIHNEGRAFARQNPYAK